MSVHSASMFAHLAIEPLAFEPLAFPPAETARLLHVSRQTIYNLINRGELRAVKIGTATRIPRTEIERLAGLAGDAG